MSSINFNHDTHIKTIEQAHKRLTDNSIKLKIEIPKQRKNKETIEFVNILYKRILEKVESNDVLTNDDIFLIANDNGKVVKVVSLEEVPNYLSINDDEYLDFGLEAIGVNSISLTFDNKDISYVYKEEHSIEQLKDSTSVSVPIKDIYDEIICVLTILTKAENPDTVIINLLKLSLELFYLKENIFKSIEKRDSLYTLTKRLYNTFDPSDVLSEAIKYIRYFYMYDELELWLINDYKLKDIPTKLITNAADMDNIINKVFIEGEMYIDKTKSQLVIPIRGNQGTYGVLKVSSKYESSLYKKNFILDIMDMVGLAFENANIYEQSNRNLKKFQLINNLTKVLNKSLHEEEILHDVVNELDKVYSAQSISFLQTNHEQNELRVIASNYEEENTIVPIDGSCIGLAYKKRAPIIIADGSKGYGTEGSLKSYFGYQSVISIPIFIEDEIEFILTIGSKQINYFKYDDLMTIELFSQHLGIAITNSYLYEKIKVLAVTDYLTTLYNRAYLDDKVKASLMEDKQGVLLLFDLDDFKKINDTYGHQVGDQVLVQIANIFKSSIRGEDIATRWGGEEFAIYLPSIDVESAIKVGNRIVERVKKETNPKMTISCGLAMWNDKENKTDYLELVHKADEALYIAKNSGKNQIQISSTH